MILGRRQDHRGSLSAIDIIKLDCFCDLLDSETVGWQFAQQQTVSVFELSVNPLFLPTTPSSSVSACRLGICKGQVNFLTQERFTRAAEYAINTVDVPCALGSAICSFR